MQTSRDPARRARQFANLRNRPPAPPAGNQRAVRHGAYARIADVDLDAKTREIFVAIAADAPVRAADGGLPAHDTIAVRLLAETLIRRDRVRAEEISHGLEIASGPRKGELRGIVQYGLRLDGQAVDLLDRLGMTPAARAKLGLDLARAARTLEDEIAAGPGWDVESDAGEVSAQPRVVDRAPEVRDRHRGPSIGVFFPVLMGPIIASIGLMIVGMTGSMFGLVMTMTTGMGMFWTSLMVSM